jgi:acyl carrier protein
MSDAKESNIEKVVLELLEYFVCSPGYKPNLTDNLIDDLKVDGDDFGIDFVQEVQRKFEIKIPVNEWNRVFTVQDVVNVVKKFIN